jgi:signal transduction histidine kinase
MYSIRTRLTLWLALGFTGLVVVAGWSAAAALCRRATADFDAVLLARARALLCLTDQEQGRIEFDYQPAAMPEFERANQPDYFEFWLDDGLVLLRSSRLDRDLPLAALPDHEPRFLDAPLPDGRSGRMVQLRWLPRGPVDPGDSEEAKVEPTPPHPESREVVLAMASDRAPLDHLAASVESTLLWFGGATVSAALALVWWSLARAFRPIARIARQVSGVDAEGLGTRVEPGAAPRELAPIVQQLNALLQRLQTSFARERRFAGNLAHELRTPIAELRSLAAVAAKWPEDRKAIAAFFGDVRNVADGMAAIVTDLLLLARCNAGVELVQREPVDLQQLVVEAWGRHRARAEARHLALQFEAPAGLRIDTDRSKLAIVLGNVFGNAIDHGHADGTVFCRVSTTADGLVLEVTNRADLLEAEDLAKATEPFWRRDSARSGEAHAGLGLALVSALAELLQVRLAVEQDEGGVFRVRLAGLLGSTALPGAATTSHDQQSRGVA